MTTWIRNASWVIAWDAPLGCHVYLRDADVVFSGNAITYVGQGYADGADELIDGRDLLVMPGLIDIHSHPSTEPFFRGIREEHGVPAMFMSGLYERSQAFHPSMAGRRAGKEVAYCEMLLTGITTVADLSGNDPGWIDLAARSGLRVFLAPGYASAGWLLENDWELKYLWDEAAGKRNFHAAMALIQEACAHPSGRLSGIVTPAQIDTCTEALLRESWEAATEKNLPFTTHCAQSVNEFNVMVQRHGKTPVQWARDIGILGPRTILGHAIFIDEHSWLHWHTREDLGILAGSGTSIAHCPSPFARYGQTLEDFGRYRRAGVTIGFGTDVAPHNLIEEMRLAAILARVSAEDITTTSTAELFHAATVGGASALGRDDIGRLAPGMKADFVLVDLTCPFMMPARDPLRSLIYTAADRAVHAVYVDGNKVVENKRVLTLDHAGALEIVAEAQARMAADVPNHDWRGRRADEIAPLSLRVR
ncbi:MAG TPA: amidohydrolase family protein [Acetobacteraceae bacterium]|nr:amidohydrolase family protein [Acetobacteraceae bacterium]